MLTMSWDDLGHFYFTMTIIYIKISRSSTWTSLWSLCVGSINVIKTINRLIVVRTALFVDPIPACPRADGMHNAKEGFQPWNIYTCIKHIKVISLIRYVSSVIFKWNWSNTMVITLALEFYARSNDRFFDLKGFDYLYYIGRYDP